METSRRLLFSVLLLALASFGRLSWGSSSGICLRLALRTLADIYEFVGPVGRGGTSDVYLGRVPEQNPPPLEGMFQPREGQRVAVKYPREEYLDLISHEARIAGLLAEKDPEGLFVRMSADKRNYLLVMEDLTYYVSLRELLGTPIDQWLGEASGLTISPQLRRKVIAELYRALEILEKAGIVHGDLNPGNIYVDPETGAIKISDFGSSAFVGTYAPGVRGSRGDRMVDRSYASANALRGGASEFADDRFVVAKIERELVGSRGWGWFRFW